MILSGEFSSCAKTSIPRESGDDPELTILAENNTVYSPRERG